MSKFDRYWLEHMPKGIPADINSGAYESLLDILRESVAQHKNQPAYYHLGTQITYGQLDQLSLGFSSSLQQNFNVSKGDRIALMAPNILAHPIAMFGALRAGATVVNINPLYTARELEILLKDSGAKIIIVLDGFTSNLLKILDQTSIEQVITVSIGDGHPRLKRWLVNFVTRYIRKLKPAPGLQSIAFSSCLHPATMSADSECNKNDLAFLQYTGGTTGTPKGAMLSHSNVFSNTLQGYACLASLFKNQAPHIITALPLYHIFALQMNCFITMKLGGCSHLITNPRDMKSFIAELGKVRFNAIVGVNTLFNAMLNQPEFAKLDFSSLQLTLAGGMAVLKSTAERWQQATGSTIIEAYGLTESSPALCANPVDLKQFNGMIGQPLPSTAISIRDDDGRPLPSDTEGELWANGPQVMLGYWNKPEATHQVLTDDGWLKTGDIASMDKKGYVRLIDRKKDMIIISGFNVYPNEIEDVLTEHPNISEAGVVGITHEETGEAIKAVIVKNNNLTEQEVIDHCRQHLAAYKVPRQIEFRDELPKTNVGKVLRRALR